MTREDDYWTIVSGGRTEQRRRRLEHRDRIVSRVYTLLATLLVIGGFAIICTPPLNQWVTDGRLTATAQAAQVSAATATDTDARLEAADEYNRRLAAQQVQIGEVIRADGTRDADFKDDTEYQNLLDFGDGIMATIEIPSIGVDLPVRHGADAYALENGAGHLHGTSLPVGGQSTHSVITGHTGVADKALFTRLTELRKGDVFYVRVAAQTLAYKVERIRKVDPDDLRDVRIQPGRDLVTLVTCTPIFLNTYRLLVTGERVSMPDDAPYPEDAPRTTGRDARPLLVSGVALLAGMPVAMVESRPRVRPYGRHGMKR